MYPCTHVPMYLIESEMKSRPAVLARKPQAWRWMVLLSRTCWSFIALGTFKAMGVFIPRFVDAFSTTTTTAGLVSSLSIGLGVISGPLVGALMTSYTPRTITVAGGAIAAICMIAASLSSSIVQVALWFALSSLGQTATQLASVKATMDYFPDDFAAANGVSLSGGPLGMMVIPLVTEYLVSVYGWRGALALLGTFSFNYIVCGMLFRPVAKTHLTTGYSLVPNISSEENASSSSDNQDHGHLSSLFRKMWNITCERFDTKILTNHMFIVYQVVSLLCGAVFSSWHLFVIPQGVELGYGQTPSAVLATYGGAGSLVGRLCHGTLIDRGFVKLSTLFVASCLVFAAATLINPLAVSSYEFLAASCAVAGVAMGVMYPLLFVFLREVTGDQHVSAFGWLFLSLATGQLIGGTLAGWIHDSTGHYEPAFVTMGGMAVTMAIIVALTTCMASCCEPKD